jgi:hypothetical protein
VYCLCKVGWGCKGLDKAYGYGTCPGVPVQPKLNSTLSVAYRQSSEVAAFVRQGRTGV